jgi:HEPN domain-containing protein
MEEFVKKLIRRSERFFINALKDFKEKEYDIAMFNLEQSLQLFLKAKILSKGVQFPKTHEIEKLLEFLSKIDKEIKLNKKEIKILKILEQAYISSRYLPFSFSEEDVKDAIELVKKIRDFYGENI